MPAVRVIAPATSNRGRVAARFSAMKRGTIANDAMAIGTLIRKTHRHEARSVMMPPSRMPAAKPRPDSAPQMLSARTRSAPGREEGGDQGQGRGRGERGTDT